ncbi:hypothetical protein BDR22DRAFT_919339 [Usnea florida]
MSASTTPALVPVASPPPGKQSNFVNPQTSMKRAIALHTICLFLVTVCVAIRLYTRLFITRKLGMDDGDARGIGRHSWDVPVVDYSPGILSVLIYSGFVYLLLVGIIKLSCLVFYRRVFSPSQTAKWFISAGMGFVVSAYIALFFANIFECSPVRKSWYPELPGHCLHPGGLPWASGAINVVSDIFVVVVPIPCIWQLNMKLQRKLRILALFSLGTFVCITSIVRLAMTAELYNGSTDRTWYLFQISIWASLTPSWRLRKDHVFDRYEMSLSSRANRSDELGLDEYTALKGENDKIERHRTFDVTVSNNDVDRLPGASEPTTFASPEYLLRQSQAHV